jgi:protein arginine kinase
MREVVSKLADAEIKARKAIFEANKPKVSDKIARCLGILKNAYLLSSSEVSESVSQLRLGLSLGIVQGITPARLTELVIASQRATVSMLEEGLDTELKRDIKRAALVRDTLRDVSVIYNP